MVDVVNEKLKLLEGNDPSLHVLDLQSYSLDNIAVRRISDALKTNTHLEVLFINNTDMDDEKLEILAEGLVQNQALMWLNVSGTDITDIGLVHFADTILATNSRLAHVDFQCQRVTETGVGCIVASLDANTRLQGFLPTFGNTKLLAKLSANRLAAEQGVAS